MATSKAFLSYRRDNVAPGRQSEGRAQLPSAAWMRADAYAAEQEARRILEESEPFDPSPESFTDLLELSFVSGREPGFRTGAHRDGGRALADALRAALPIFEEMEREAHHV